jgi:hypothetical protein
MPAVQEGLLLQACVFGAIALGCGGEIIPDQLT